VSLPAISTHEHERDTVAAVFRFLLYLPDGEPHDPHGFVTVMPLWHVGDAFLITPIEKLRIVEIDAEIDEQLVERGLARSGTSSRSTEPPLRSH